jgi:hypothetical protein
MLGYALARIAISGARSGARAPAPRRDYGHGSVPSDGCDRPRAHHSQHMARTPQCRTPSLTTTLVGSGS